MFILLWTLSSESVRFTFQVNPVHEETIPFNNDK